MKLIRKGIRPDAQSTSTDEQVARGIKQMALPALVSLEPDPCS